MESARPTAGDRKSPTSEPDPPAEHPGLVAAEAAFKAGDYRRVRQLCKELEGSADPQLSARARALRRRTDVDPIQVALLSLCLVVFVAIAYRYLL